MENSRFDIDGYFYVLVFYIQVTKKSADKRLLKVAPYCFLKSVRRQISTSESTMNISEKNETKDMYRI